MNNKIIELRSFFFSLWPIFFGIRFVNWSASVVQIAFVSILYYSHRLTHACVCVRFVSPHRSTFNNDFSLIFMFVINAVYYYIAVKYHSRWDLPFCVSVSIRKISFGTLGRFSPLALRRTVESHSLWTSSPLNARKE